MHHNVKAPVLTTIQKEILTFLIAQTEDQLRPTGEVMRKHFKICRRRLDSELAKLIKKGCLSRSDDFFKTLQVRKDLRGKNISLAFEFV